MKCDNYREMISLYIDGKLDTNGNEKIQEHLKECEHCKRELDELLAIREILLETPVVELPEGFKETLHEKLLQASEEKDEEVIQEEKDDDNSNVYPMKKRKRVKWKVFSAVAALILIMVVSVATLKDLGLRGLQQKSEMAQEDSNNFGVMEEKMVAPEMNKGLTNDRVVEDGQPHLFGSRRQDDISLTVEREESAESKDISIAKTTGRKVILNGYMQLDVDKYDVIQDRIVNMVVSRGGFVENSNTRYKYFNRNQLEESLKEGNITLRIPENEFYNIYNNIKGFGTVIDSRVNTSDITGQYRDTANEVENLKIQESRLREIMDKATNVKEILEVERELSRVRGDINRLTGNIKKWDNLVNLSTIEVFLNEVKLGDVQIQSINDSIWSKSKKGFVRTTNGLINLMERLLIRFISLLPLLIILSVLSILVYSIYRKVKIKK